MKNKKNYYEVHHIKPVCIGGNGKSSEWRWHPNLVLLTAKEHFLAHLFLCKIYPNEKKVLLAYNFMSNFGKLSSKEYSKKRIKATKPGYSWYTNSKFNIKIYENMIIPEGFTKGFICKSWKKELINSNKIFNKLSNLDNASLIQYISNYYEKEFMKSCELFNFYKQKIHSLDECYVFLLNKNDHPYNKLANKVLLLFFEEKLFLHQLENFPSIAENLQIFYEKNPLFKKYKNKKCFQIFKEELIKEENIDLLRLEKKLIRYEEAKQTLTTYS